MCASRAKRGRRGSYFCPNFLEEAYLCPPPRGGLSAKIFTLVQMWPPGYRVKRDRLPGLWVCILPETLICPAYSPIFLKKIFLKQ